MLNKQVPGINITGLGTVRDVNVFPGGFFPTEYQLKDTFSMIHGSHALKIGGEVRRAINILWHTASFVPVYTFASILDFVDDEPQQMTRTVDPRTGLPTTTRADMLIWEGAGFVQDDWKVRRNLTINIGLRYDYFGPYTDTARPVPQLRSGNGLVRGEARYRQGRCHSARMGHGHAEFRATLRICVGYRRQGQERDSRRVRAFLRPDGHRADRDLPDESAAGGDGNAGTEFRNGFHLFAGRSRQALSTAIPSMPA